MNAYKITLNIYGKAAGKFQEGENNNKVMLI